MAAGLSVAVARAAGVAALLTAAAITSATIPVMTGMTGDAGQWQIPAIGVQPASSPVTFRVPAPSRTMDGEAELSVVRGIMFAYAIGHDGTLLMIANHHARPILQLPDSITEDQASNLAGRLTELSEGITRSLGTFHRPPIRARMDARWAERRQASLAILRIAFDEGPAFAPSDPRYRVMRNAAHDLRSVLRAIGDSELTTKVAAAIDVEISDVEAREDIAIFGRSRHADREAHQPE